jgi:hypothetical protein
MEIHVIYTCTVFSVSEFKQHTSLQKGSSESFDINLFLLSKTPCFQGLHIARVSHYPTANLGKKWEWSHYFSRNNFNTK